MNESTKRRLRLYEDFGDEPDWIKNVPEGYLLTKSVNRFPAIGLSEAKGAATNRFMRDRGVKSGYIRNMPRAEEWYDKNTNTAYALTDTTKPTIVGLDQERLPGDRMVTISGADLSEEISPELQEMMDRRHRPDAASTDPTRPSALIRERRASEDPLTDAISDDSDDAIDLAGLEPPTGTQRSASQDRIVGRDSAMLGMPTQSTTVRQDDQLTKRLVGENIDENDDYGSLPITSFQEDTATSLLREARKRNAGGAGAPSDAVRVDSPNNLQIGRKGKLYLNY